MLEVSSALQIDLRSRGTKQGQSKGHITPNFVRITVEVKARFSLKLTHTGVLKKGRKVVNVMKGVVNYLAVYIV